MPAPTLLLTDNGSRRPEAFANLTRLATALSDRLGEDVIPVSMMHTPEGSDGTARTIRPFLEAGIAAGQYDYRMIPLFLGPSGALSSYLARTVTELQVDHPQLSVRVGDLLHRPDENDLLRILREHIDAAGLPEAPVLVVDHGSPNPEVTKVRDCLSTRLQGFFWHSRVVQAASMERREGPEYDFNDPLLSEALASEGVAGQPCILAMLFMGPGRHAGEGGDIDTIVAAAEGVDPGLIVTRTPLLSEHTGFLDLLERRARAVLA